MTELSSAEIFRNIIALVILLPAFWYLMKQNDKRHEENNKNIIAWLDRISTIFEESTKWIKDMFKEHENLEYKHIEKIDSSIIANSNIMNKWFNSMYRSLWNTYLNTEQSVDILKSKMWLVSYGKIEYLRNVILWNHFKGREEQIKKSIRSELERQSLIYIEDFKQYSTPIGILSDWLTTTFTEQEFDSFSKEVCDVVFSDRYSEYDKVAQCELKLKDISGIMKDVQNNLSMRLMKWCKEQV